MLKQCVAIITCSLTLARKGAKISSALGSMICCSSCNLICLCCFLEPHCSLACVEKYSKPDGVCFILFVANDSIRVSLERITIKRLGGKKSGTNNKINVKLEQIIR